MGNYCLSKAVRCYSRKDFRKIHVNLMVYIKPADGIRLITSSLAYYYKLCTIDKDLLNHLN